MIDYERINQLFKGKNRTLASQLLEIVDSLKQYAPFTVRQVYYQAVAKLYIPNELKHYKRVSEVLTELRRADLMSWSLIEDRTRRTTSKRGNDNVESYLESEAKWLFSASGYSRCYVQKQSIYAELVIEKDALSSLVDSVTWPYCTRLNVGRGQMSASIVNQIAERLDSAIMKGLEPVLLYLGDLDPSGVAIPRNLKNALYDSHSIDVEVRRLALNPEQVKQYQLPETVDAAKKTDSNFKAWTREYGDHPPVELDALHPRDLKQLVKDGLESVYDMAAFRSEIEQEERDREKIRIIRADVQQFLKQRFPAEFPML